MDLMGKVKEAGGSKVQEILEQIKEDAGEVLKTFSTLYLLNCGCALLENIREEIQRKNGELPAEVPWRLTKRVGERSEGLYRGELWMRIGGGAGDFDKWRKVFVVEKESCDIVIYESKESIAAAKKPLATIQPCGYKLITNVKGYYEDDLHDLINDLPDLVAEEMTSDMGDYSWALVHPIRPQYVFQARPSTLKSKGACWCCSRGEVEPEEQPETEEERLGRVKATEFMRACIDLAHPRDLATIEGMAFEMTMRQLPLELDKLRDDWINDGTEGEMLADILVEVCLSFRKEQLLNELKGPLSVRIGLWHKTRKMVHKLVNELVQKCWELARTGATALREQLEPGLRTGLTPIVEFKMKIEKRVNEAIIDKIGSFLGDFVTPFVKPLMELYEKPLLVSLDATRKLLEKQMNPKSLPSGAKEREEYLDKLMFDTERRDEIFENIDKISEALEQLRSFNENSSKVFQGVQYSRISNQIKRVVGELLEAAVYTYKIRLNPSLAGQQTSRAGGDVVVLSDLENTSEGKGNTNKDLRHEDSTSNTTEASHHSSIFSQVMKDFDHDVQIVRSQFIKNSVHTILLESFHRLTGKALASIVKRIDEAIPGNFEKFLSLQKVLDDVANRLVLGPVQQMVDKAYPLPQD